MSWLFATQWTAARQAALSITNSQSLLKLLSIELVMPSNPLILCCPLLLLRATYYSLERNKQTRKHASWPKNGDAPSPDVWAWCLLVLVAQSCPTLCDPVDCTHRLLCPWDSPGKNTGASSYSLFQRIFPTQELNPGLLNCIWILYHLSHQRSPCLLELS